MSSPTPLTPWLGYQPREWQPLAVGMLWERLSSPDPGCPIIAACTGSGKSIAQAELAARVLQSSRLDPSAAVVVSVPRLRLVEQMTDTMRLRLGARSVSRWDGSHRPRRPRRLIVTTYDSMPQLADRLAVQGRRCALWIADECHRYYSERHREAVAALSPLRRCGWTATPVRTADDEGLRDAGWTDLLYRYTIRDGIRDGAIVPPDPIPWDGSPDVDVDDAMTSMVLRYGEGPGVVDAFDIPDAEEYAAKLTAAGRPAAAVHSQLPREEFDRLTAAMLRGEVVLVHVDMLTEGVDFPALRWLGIRRPTDSLIRYVQQVGRVLRRYPGKASGRVLDPLGMFRKYKLPTFRDLEDPLAVGAAWQSAAERAVAGGGEPDEGERVLPLAVAVPDVEEYLASLREELGAECIGGAWRTMPATPKQVAALRAMDEDRRRDPARHLPEPQRRAVRAARSHPERLTRGAASDLLGSMYKIKEQTREHYARHRTWRGFRPKHDTLSDPPAEAVEALEAQ